MLVILITSSLFVTVAVLAARYGRTSQESIASKEAELAAYGVTWHGRGHAPLDEELAAELQRTRIGRTQEPTASQGRSRPPAQAPRATARPGVMLDAL